MVTASKCHGTGQIELELGRQTFTLNLNPPGIGQTTQLLHQRLLLGRQTCLLGLTALFCIVGCFHAVDGLGDVFQPGNGMPEAIDLEIEVTLRQFRQRLATVVQQAHGEIRPARQRRTQRQAETQAKQMAGPITGKHSNLLDQYVRSVPNPWHAVRQPLFDLHAGG